MSDNETNILYYDAIAAEYDSQLNSDERNVYIRDVVASKFSKEVSGRLVLDFGGGTGRDFGWLLKHHYQIVFCEPSRAMRQIAKDRRRYEFPGSQILFLEDEQTEFRNWSVSYPFGDKMDAVLANFAVINCIQDIRPLFEKLAMALKKDGQVIALVLDDDFIRLARINPGAAIRAFVSGAPVKQLVNHNNLQQEVYWHSMRSIRVASRLQFRLISITRLKGFGFRLVHLMRK